MQRRNTHSGHRWLGLCILAAVGLGACTSAPADLTPTVGVEAIYTAAVETYQAQQATQLALTPPTATPSPSPFPTQPPLSPFPTISFATAAPAAGSSACDNAAYVADVTIPDGTVVTPGQSFQKKWKLQNNGSCTWSTSYQLAFSSGSQMGGSPSFIKVPVPPGNQTEVAVQLTAPSAAGSYTGTWQMENANGQSFGNFITVVITVGSSSATVTPGPSPTAGPSPTGGPGPFTISGYAGATDVTLTYTGTTSGTTTSDSVTGDYSIAVPSGWTGTITPSKGKAGKWSFTPSSQSFTNVTADLEFDFQASSTTPTPTATP